MNIFVKREQLYIIKIHDQKATNNNYRNNNNSITNGAI